MEVKRPDLALRPDFESTRPDFRCESPGLGSEKPNLGSKGPDLGSKGLRSRLALGGTPDWKSCPLWIHRSSAQPEPFDGLI